MKKESGVNERNSDGEMPLHIAARLGHAEWTEELLKIGARGNATNREHQLPIHVAVQNRRADAVKVLLKYKPFIGMDKTGDLPHHLAARTNQPDVIKLLQDYKDNSQKADAKGKSAIIIAAENGYAECVQVLWPWYKDNLSLQARWSLLSMQHSDIKKIADLKCKRVSKLMIIVRNLM